MYKIKCITNCTFNGYNKHKSYKKDCYYSCTFNGEALVIFSDNGNYISFDDYKIFNRNYLDFGYFNFREFERREKIKI